jgi:hypothetical protein
MPSLGDRPNYGDVPRHIYNAWYHMIARCYHPSTQYFEHYGGRGITVCDRWRSSVHAFFEDMGDRPRGYTLDRIDCNGHYEPSNCRWATWAEQANNRRNNNIIAFNGIEKTVTVWARELRITPASLLQRIGRYGIEMAFSHDFAQRMQLIACAKRATAAVRSEPFSNNGLRWKKKTSSHFVGVSKCHGGYQAYLKRGDQFVFRKWFKSELQAALARDDHAFQEFGTRARLNFPERFAAAKESVNATCS